MSFELPSEVKEAYKRETRRFNEEQRKKRILDDKVLKMGIDVQGLKRQIAEKQQQRILEKEQKEQYARELANVAEKGRLQDRQMSEAARQLNKSINHFRFFYQTPKSRRDFDLSDPEALRKSAPPRVSDNDDRCGVSSLQRFTGEDLAQKERLRLQQMRLKDNLTEQIRLKQKIEDEARRRGELTSQLMQNRLKEERELELKKSALRRELSLADQDYNQFLAGNKRSANLQRRQQEADANYREMLNHLQSDILKENPRLAKSAYGRHRVTPDRWKGLTGEEISEILKQQKAQAEEQKKSRQSEREWHQYLERALLERDRNEILEQRHRERLRKEENKRIMEENLILANEQKARQFLRSAPCRTNAGDFFARFGQSCR